MEIIPVIDLKDGQVVHARGGLRDSYEPIHSSLVDGSAPLDVVRGLCDLHPFSTLYVADLDAIEGRGEHGSVLRDLKRAFPGLRLWVDNGLSSETECRAWLLDDRGALVLGSESQEDTATLESLRDQMDAGRVILSLDFKGDDFLGPPALLERTGSWPPNLIAMTLARVGGASGPDIARLKWLRERAPGRRIYGAGGVRNVGDLNSLDAIGVSGVLVASALHDGRIGKTELEPFGLGNA